MTKRVTILALCLIAGADAETNGQPTLAYPGSTLDLDDNTAGLLVVAGKARHDKDAKLKNTAKEHEAGIEERAKALTTPETAMATMIAQAVTAAISAMQPAKSAAA